TKFDDFWNEMACYFEENVLSVHERRHNNMLYLPSFISVRDLRESIVERLENKYHEHPLSDNHLVPSDRWISYQFCPKNPWYKASAQYTGRFQIKYMVQTRQLRKTHVDVHYCQAIFKYIRHFASKYKKYTCLIFADDKHKIPIGEVVPTSTGVRNKKMATLVMAQIDPELDKSMTTMNQLQKRQSYQNFIKNKDHYKDFDQIYSQPTSERFRPSAMNITVNEEISEKKQGQFINTKIRYTILCEHCGKMRCVYSNVNLTNNEEIKLQSTLDGLCYTCGSQLLPDDHELSNQISVRLNLTCDSPIESTYFSWRSKKIDICYWCGESENLIEPSDKLKSEWKIIYPLCEYCKNNGKTWHKRAQKKFISLNNSDSEEENN
ncbi:12545_t:CDS:2, partial [Gigaspora margarita]